jgi:hypothetical protein
VFARYLACEPWKSQGLETRLAELFRLVTEDDRPRVELLHRVAERGRSYAAGSCPLPRGRRAEHRRRGWHIEQAVAFKDSGVSFRVSALAPGINHKSLASWTTRSVFWGCIIVGYGISTLF